ncbi:uncharacterized protein BKA78DRAFT_318061 [Phyllosticta capitalensis]|uniref:uncharacterized protein n=1 Tax=Phyllosticta capitalensis TaxID=121624 RepID=UPI00312ED7CF
MLASALTSALALFAAGAAAAPAAAAPATKDVIDLSALKTSYYWNVTDVSSSFVPSGVYRSLDFTVAFSAQPNTTHCRSGYGYQPGMNRGGRYDPCDNPVVLFTSDLNVDIVQLSQQFVYKGVNVLVNGSAPLNMYGNSDACKYSTSGGGTCTQKQVTVKVSSATVMTKKN